MDIPAMLSSLKVATDIAKFIKDSDVSLEKAESKLRLADLISALADARIEASEIQQLLSEKDAEIRQLKERLEVSAKLKWQAPYYWLVDGANKDGPFCQHCYDKNRQLIRLQSHGNGSWQCKACQNYYTDDSYEPPSIGIASTDYDPYS